MSLRGDIAAQEDTVEVAQTKINEDTSQRDNLNTQIEQDEQAKTEAQNHLTELQNTLADKENQMHEAEAQGDEADANADSLRSEIG